MSPLVALVTDFGRMDSYVAEMHLAIHRLVPAARILDVSHDVPPFDRAAAALVIERALARLPAGAALAAVVDPGVGTARRRLVARMNGIWLVGPDNGVLPLHPSRVEAFEIRETMTRPAPGVTTFDGREVFAPLAALLAAGLRPEFVGVPVTGVIPSVLAEDATFEDGPDGLRAHGLVVALDRYGNAVTNVRPKLGADLSVVSPERFSGTLRRAYGEVEQGKPLALVGSSGRLELAVREGHSGLAIGQKVVVRCGR